MAIHYCQNILNMDNTFIYKLYLPVKNNTFENLHNLSSCQLFFFYEK